MPDTKTKKPKSPDRTNNLLHGGKQGATCPRCKNPRYKGHDVPQLTESDELRRVLGTVVAALRQDTSVTTKAFMIGALEARINNKQYRLVASSGRQETPWVTKAHIPSGWKIVEPALPNDRTGWWNIRGDRVDFPEMAGVTRPCAAMKLLLGLAREIPKWGSVQHVFLAEEYFKGKAYVPDPRNPEPRQWRGKGDLCSYTAESCDQCEARIPYLICDVPANAVPDPD
ncbi:hypothetical protein [Streptomyces sp. NPDC001678]|uniref:hypothetical protein n=1 Tax=Streptomyces sp. NPDC001678 TaxID=3364599 RepID=UPI0036AEC28B